MSLQELRDVVVIVYGVMGIVLMVALAIAAFGLLFAVRTLTRAITSLLDDPVRPMLDEAQRTMHNVRGTTDFVADATVRPLIRAISLVRGVRKGVSTVTGRGRRGR